jgi:hypothetical protein
METLSRSPQLHQAGSALVLTLIMTGIALAILASAMSWSAHTTQMTHRSIQYTRSVAAAEAGTEKVLSQMTKDYLAGGAPLVSGNLGSYRTLVPSTTDSSYWSRWEFNNAEGNVGRSYVQLSSVGTYASLGGTFSSLRGVTTTYTVVAHARESNAPQNVVAGVLQGIKLTRVPIFQFAMYSSGIMELQAGRNMTITGPVHANDTIYTGPSSNMTFKGSVSSAGSIIFGFNPNGPNTNTPSGTVVYEQQVHEHVGALTLPIGATNTPAGIREIIHPPPVGEDPNSTIGRLRYYNQADMILTVSATGGITATSGKFNNFTTLISSNELRAMVTTTNQFDDDREVKTVRPIDINIGALAAWSLTNTSLRPALGSNVSSVYVVDQRTLGTNLGAVRLVNGRQLPASGLTVVTARPLYVWGHYNQPNSANLGTSNTLTTLPASLIADAVTALSPKWTDANSFNSLASRIADPVTVNAAILTGVVETTSADYSGGMENFIRLLETWSTNGVTMPVTYNGSMVKMFPSLYATNRWRPGLKYYTIPLRSWAYDRNFDTEAKLPPLTPSLMYVARGQWANVAADSNASP